MYVIYFTIKLKNRKILKQNEQTIVKLEFVFV